MTTAQNYRYIIKRRVDGHPGWTVVPSDGDARPLPGSTLTWEFEAGTNEAVEAHFQFCDPMEGNPQACFIQSGQIGRDWDARIGGASKANNLTGTLMTVPPGRYHYAVWIKEKNSYEGFAIGHNPPPNIQTGP